MSRERRAYFVPVEYELPGAHDHHLDAWRYMVSISDPVTPMPWYKRLWKRFAAWWVAAPIEPK